MSWLQALGNLQRRVIVLDRGRTPLPTAAVYNRVMTPSNSRRLNLAEHPSASATDEFVEPSTAALRCTSDTWQGALDVVHFSQSNLQEDVNSTMQRFPPLLAAQCIAILLEAGKSDQALELLRTWEMNQGECTVRLAVFKPHVKLSVTRRLRKAIKTLGIIGDVETLRALIAVLHQSLLEWRDNRRYFALSQSSSSSMSPSRFAGSGLTQREGRSSGFLSHLGRQRMRVLLVDATHELVRQDESLVSVSEKLTWINETTLVVQVPCTQVPCVIPYKLQDDFRKHIECSSSYNENALRLVGPTFAEGFVSPAQSNLISLLCTPRSEVRWVRDNCSVGKFGELWGAVKDLVLPHSELINNYVLVESLMNAMLSPVGAKKSWRRCHRRLRKLLPTERKLRSFIWSQLNSTRSSQRRLWSHTLLRHPRLMCKLDMSPLVIFSVFALTFRSRSTHLPFLRCCLLSMQRMRRIGREEEAARLVWNHVSHCSSALLRQCIRRPNLLEEVTVALCRTMHRGISGRKDSWMGHRSLAVLRSGAALRQFTPALCIPLCAAALDCGVHFATVQQHVAEIYRWDERTERWVLNMVRLIADCHSALMRVPLNCSLHSSYMRGLVQRVAYELPTLSSTCSIEVQVPSRNKLLALWTIVNDDVANGRLRQLTCQLFLDPVARSAFKEMRLADEVDNCNSGTDGGGGSKCRVPRSTLKGLLNEEVFVSVAVNCTTEHAFAIFMNAFLSTRQARDKLRYMHLVLSEMPFESTDICPRCTTETGNCEVS
ncbi:hypothetical protein, conserved [Trypanosoma brucei brucei TREU927]|uniref:Uncharacterized protein n=1 Tax=Trypanosoma brucei brucei (strain 927/4 GUTat10.1) TaxID=185431 RepID=Q385N5_TRYB2|nr:hypothetical protein, conserved [Trypanosoma brucei brucei TREU927]EAN79496.1 hypothetical protein, conserved [Trypanosoma brucei brucei TREU927]